jgi:hypothetical protein
MRQAQTYRYAAPMPAGPGWGAAAPAGPCRPCGQPSGSCCCGCRECRKESRELLVTPQDGQRAGDANAPGRLGAIALSMANPANADAVGRVDAAAGLGQAFIGGGCCVSLSVEYAPSSPTVQAVVGIVVSDSEGTILSWIRTEPVGAGYKVKECVITTNPGAHLVVVASNCTARVRWCEIFSC